MVSDGLGSYDKIARAYNKMHIRTTDTVRYVLLIVQYQYDTVVVSYWYYYRTVLVYTSGTNRSSILDSY